MISVLTEEDVTCESDKKLNNEYILPSLYHYEINDFSLTNIQIIFLIGLLEKYRPNNICEFGAVESTKIFETYVERYNKSFLNIEQDEKYLYKSSKLFPLKHEAPLVINKQTYKRNGIYEGLEEFFKNYQKEKFDFVLIDGPYANQDVKKYEYVRLQMVYFIEFDLLQDEGYFLIHDSSSEGSKNSIKILLPLFERKYDLQIEYVEKGIRKELTVISFKKKH
jgi:16S rRNA G966 N2-methylase RsmD